MGNVPLTPLLAAVLCALLWVLPPRAAKADGNAGTAGALWIEADQAALRVWRSSQAEVLLRLPRGALVTPLYVQPPWTRVREPGGQEGWVYQGQLTESPPALARPLLGLFDPEPPSMILAEVAESARSTRSASVHSDRVHSDRVHADRVHADGVHSDRVHADRVHADGVHSDETAQALRGALDLPLSPDELDDFLAAGGVGEFAPEKRQRGTRGQATASPAAAERASFPHLTAAAPPGGEVERQVGLNMAATVLSRLAKPAFGTARARYVNLVGLAVARFAPGEGARLRVIVLESPRPISFSLPGGIVMVSTGLLAALDNEAQLAAVLAHETAHAALRHLWARARQAPFLRDGGRLDPVSVAGPAFVAMLDDLLATALVRGLDRDLEFAADLAAVEMLWRAGYDPRELPRAIERIGRAGKATGLAAGLAGNASAANDAGLKAWPALHPPEAERQERLRRLLVTLPARNALALGTARYRANR
ncbi:MAG: hypothetical protein AUJ49_08450 [Desulfovibrionaceae bacterium CG1_02_65_16]|nr:MAG: hypothetical protein AUJ49_08450 [Desulfovibrionaceae bacterium CG1_02_65_16]